MIAEDLSILHFSAMGLLLALLTARIAKRNHGSFFKSLLAGGLLTDDHPTDRMFEKHHILALKQCPNCAEQLPLSTLMCEACDYNFLSGMVGQGHRLLPSPEPRVHEMPARILAYRA